MEGHISRIALLNLPVAGDVDTTNMPGWARITGLIPMPTTDDIVVTEVVAATEVLQEYTLNSSAAITASTRYGLRGQTVLKVQPDNPNRMQPHRTLFL